MPKTRLIAGVCFGRVLNGAGLRIFLPGNRWGVSLFSYSHTNLLLRQLPYLDSSQSDSFCQASHVATGPFPPTHMCCLLVFRLDSLTKITPAEHHEAKPFAAEPPCLLHSPWLRLGTGLRREKRCGFAWGGHACILE